MTLSCFLPLQTYPEVTPPISNVKRTGRSATFDTSGKQAATNDKVPFLQYV